MKYYIEFNENQYKNLKKFAVYIPILEKNGEDYLLFEKRAADIRQPGEISFPGGSLEEGESFRKAAARELAEELGLKEDEFSKPIFSSSLFFPQFKVIEAFYGKIYRKEDNIDYNREVSGIFTKKLSRFRENPPKLYKTPLKLDFEKGFPFEKIPSGRAYPFKIGYHEDYFYDENPVIRGLTARLLKDFLENYKNEKEH